MSGSGSLGSAKLLLKATTTEVPEGYELIKSPMKWADVQEEEDKKKAACKPDTKNVEAVVVKSSAVLARSRMLRSILTNRTHAKPTHGQTKYVTKAVPRKLVINGSSSSSTNANLVFNIPVAPGGSSEFSNWAAEFDEFRITHYRLRYLVMFTTGVTINATFFVVVHDPMNNSSLTGYQAALEFDEFAVHALGTGLSLTPVNEDGYYRFHPKMSPGVLSSNVAATTVVSKDEWTPTSTSNTACGYAKFFVPALGAAAISTVTWLMEIYCEFRVTQ